MKSLKPIPHKRSKKQEREHRVLLGLVQLYLESGKPIGSGTLKEAGFPELSSATIRNYFAHLETQGYLSQQHASGGRVPTAKAYRAYAEEHVDSTQPEQDTLTLLQPLLNHETREIAAYLQKSGELLSDVLGLPIFLSAPRFDHDFVMDIKLLRVDVRRCLVVLITDFGLVQTEVIPLSSKLNTFALHRMEAYFHWRLTGYGKPENLKAEEEKLAQQLYNEIMVRYLVTYTNCSHEQVFQTGFSRVLQYPEFGDPQALAEGLSLFENTQAQRLILRETGKAQAIRYWVGEDLSPFGSQSGNCSVVACPYGINQSTVGALGVLGPMRMPYREVFSILTQATNMISQTLTRSVYKYKISYRHPTSDQLKLDSQQEELLKEPILLEDKRH